MNREDYPPILKFFLNGFLLVMLGLSCLIQPFFTWALVWSALGIIVTFMAFLAFMRGCGRFTKRVFVKVQEVDDERKAPVQFQHTITPALPPPPPVGDLVADAMKLADARTDLSPEEQKALRNHITNLMIEEIKKRAGR